MSRVYNVSISPEVIAALRKVQPISKMPPTRDHSDKHTFHLDYDTLADIDNALQKIEYNHMKQGEALREFRHRLNMHILPGRVR